MLNHLVAVFLRAVSRIAGRGVVKQAIAENLVLRHQLLVLNRSRKRAPQVSPWDRLWLGFLAAILRPRRMIRNAVVFRPATLLRFHKALVRRKYRLLFSGLQKHRPGPKGPDARLIYAIVEFKRRNPRCGCPRIAQQISATFGIEIDKDLVRRVLAKHYKPKRRDAGPSWLSFLGHSKDCLWSVDLFRTESILLKTHWVMVVMDQHTRRIVGFAVQVMAVDGASACRMFGEILGRAGVTSPKRLSHDRDPWFKFDQWIRNPVILGIEAVHTVPLVPLSHPFVERLIWTVRREFLDQVFYWNATDLQRKLASFQSYYNKQRTHQGLDGQIPDGNGPPIALESISWKPLCNGSFHMPTAA